MSSFEEIRKTLQENGLEFHIGKRKSFTWTLLGSKASEMQVINCVNRNLNANFGTQSDIEEYILGLKNEDNPDCKGACYSSRQLMNYDGMLERSNIITDIDEAVFNLFRVEKVDNHPVIWIRDFNVNGNVFCKFSLDDAEFQLNSCGITERLSKLLEIMLSRINSLFIGEISAYDDEKILSVIEPVASSSLISGLKFYKKVILNKQGKEICVGLTLSEAKSRMPMEDLFKAFIDKKISLARFDSRPALFSNNPEEETMNYIKLPEHKPINENNAWEIWLRRHVSESSARVFRAWVYGLFDIENNGSQVMYLIDRGGTGKSSIISSLVNYFNRSAICVTKESLNNQFGASKIWNKRLVGIGDNKNPRLISSQIFHSMSGGDYVDVEYKNDRATFNSKLACKVIVASNVELEFENEEHNTRRAIIIHPDDSTETKEKCNQMSDGQFVGNSGFIASLDRDIEEFISGCYTDYKELCPNRSQIKLNEEILGNMASCDDGSEQEILSFIEKYFLEEIPESAEDAVQVSTVKALIKLEGKTNRLSSLEYSRVKNYLCLNGFKYNHIKKLKVKAYNHLRLKESAVRLLNEYSSAGDSFSI